MLPKGRRVKQRFYSFLHTLLPHKHFKCKLVLGNFNSVYILNEKRNNQLID